MFKASGVSRREQPMSELVSMMKSSCASIAHKVTKTKEIFHKDPAIKQAGTGNGLENFIYIVSSRAFSFSF